MSNFHRKTLIITIQKFCNSLDIDDCDGLPPLPQPPPPPPPPSPPLETQSLSPLILFMICSLAAIFSFICYIATIKIIRIFRNRRHRNINEAHQDYVVDLDHEPVVFHPIWLINTIGLDQSVIDSIEIFKYRKKDGLFMEGSDSDCAICLGEFQDDESLRIMPKCSHSFHVACIDTWLRSHKNCPVCRAPVVKNSSIHQVDQSSTELNPQEDIPIGHVENEMIRTEIEQEINTNVESLETKSLTSGVRVQSDLTDRCSRKPEPMKRSISMGSFCFVDQELGESKKLNVVQESAKRQGSSSKTYLFGPSSHN